ncbi:MAG: hypothetical protein ABID09_01280 [Candidatus Omnitrophota bacterium]
MKNRICAALILAFLLMPAGVACSSDETEARILFSQGNQFYGQEKFEEAILSYEKILEMGLESGPVYYNLGNAYFKHGSPGKAILNYLRAGRILPNDEDFKSNLYYAESFIKDPAAPGGERWPARTFKDLAGHFTLSAATIMSSALYFLLSLAIILAIATKGSKKIFMYAGAPLLILLVLFSSIFFSKLSDIVINKRAVIITQRSDSKFEPFISATTYFTLSEGESVIVITTKDDWTKIKRIDGKQGWTKGSDLELL